MNYAFAQFELLVTGEKYVMDTKTKSILYVQKLEYNFEIFSPIQKHHLYFLNHTIFQWHPFNIGTLPQKLNRFEIESSNLFLLGPLPTTWGHYRLRKGKDASPATKDLFTFFQK